MTRVPTQRDVNIRRFYCSHSHHMLRTGVWPGARSLHLRAPCCRRAALLRAEAEAGPPDAGHVRGACSFLTSPSTSPNKPSWFMTPKRYTLPVPSGDFPSGASGKESVCQCSPPLLKLSPSIGGTEALAHHEPPSPLPLERHPRQGHIPPRWPPCSSRLRVWQDDQPGVEVQLSRTSSHSTEPKAKELCS